MKSINRLFCIFTCLTLSSAALFAYDKNEESHSVVVIKEPIILENVAVGLGYQILDFHIQRNSNPDGTCIVLGFPKGAVEGSMKAELYQESYPHELARYRLTYKVASDGNYKSGCFFGMCRTITSITCKL